MATFNENKLYTLFNSRDWSGAADYLSSLSAASPQQQIILNNKIASLRRQGEIQSAILSKLSPVEQEAFHFISAFSGQGTIPHKQVYKNGTPVPNTANSFGDAYTKAINDFKDAKGNKINSIDLTFANQDVLNDFYNKLGITPQELKTKYNCQLNTDAKTGKLNITTATNNLRLIDLFKAYDKVIPEKSIIGSDVTMTAPNAFDKSGMTPYNAPSISSEFNVPGTQQMAVTDVYSSNKTMLLKRQLLDIYEKAERLNDAALDKYKAKEIEEEMYVTPYLGKGQIEAYNALKKGLIDIDGYKKIVDERTDVYNRLLAQSDFTQYKLYTTNPEGDGNTVLREIDNKLRNDVKQKLLIAIKDKRVTYSAAIHGGETGTYITISPDKDKDGNFSKGDTEQGMTLFIPGLFKSSCDEVFERDTKTLAVRDLADMKHWEYGKTLSSGEYVGYDKDYGTYIKMVDEYGKSIKVPKGEDYILHKLNEDHIVSQSAMQLSTMFNDDGSIKTINKNGKETPRDIQSMGDLLASAGVNELYPQGQYSEDDRLSAKNNIYIQIMNILNWNKQNKLN